MLVFALLTLISTEPPAAKTLFAGHCALCHGSDGGGRTAEGLRLPGPSLQDPRRRATWKPQSLVAQILEGKGAMPAHRGKLKPEEATTLATWLLESSKRKK